ncbi:MAG TPA: GatB/YqeY domain-containing protein [Candidatus Limnocylindrales bacterium]
MTLRQRLQAGLTAAIRSQDSLRRDVLRMAWAAAYAVEKREHHELGDDELLTVLTREVKTRRESVEAFRRGGREDLASREEAEIGVLQELLPQPLGEAELEALVAEAVSATGAASPRDMGKVMGWLSPRTRGRADGRHVSELVGRALAAASADAPEAGRAR